METQKDVGKVSISQAMLCMIVSSVSFIHKIRQTSKFIVEYLSKTHTNTAIKVWCKVMTTWEDLFHCFLWKMSSGWSQEISSSTQVFYSHTAVPEEGFHQTQIIIVNYSTSM